MRRSVSGRITFKAILSLAFIAAVIGGIGNIVGAVLGGFLLGLCEILIVALLPNLAEYRDAFAFLLLIGVLLFRPTGIMGEPIIQ